MVWLKYRDIKGKSLLWYREFFICNCSISICQFRFFIPSRNALRAHPILRGFSYASFFNISQKWLSKFLMENRSFLFNCIQISFSDRIYIFHCLCYLPILQSKSSQKSWREKSIFCPTCSWIRLALSENLAKKVHWKKKEFLRNLCEAAALTNFGIYFPLHKKCNLRHSCPKCVYTHL